jgi:hypothetical protein
MGNHQVTGHNPTNPTPRGVLWRTCVPTPRRQTPARGTAEDGRRKTEESKRQEDGK